MSPGPDDAAGGGRLDEADRVLLLALQAWAPAGRGGRAPEGRTRGILALGSSTGWSRRGPGGCARAKFPGEPTRPAARSIGPRRGSGSGKRNGPRPRVDPARVHPSWWARGLQDESPSVRRAVVAAAPEPIRGQVQAGLAARQRRPAIRSAGRSRGPGVGLLALDRAAGRRRAGSGRRPARHRRDVRLVAPRRLSPLPVRGRAQAGPCGRPRGRSGRRRSRRRPARSSPRSPATTSVPHRRRNCPRDGSRRGSGS